MKALNIYSIKRMILLTVLAVVFSSCKKFLDEQPSKTTSLEVTTTAQLNALLNNYSTFYQERNKTAIYATDDTEIPTALYDARPSSFPMSSFTFGLWDINAAAKDAPDNFWTGEFNKIFHANMVLSYLDKVTGTAEEKAILKADAHFIRAYSYFQLAVNYCLPYTPATRNEMGLPLKTSTSFEAPLKRESLEKVYQMIESDLTEALKISLPLVQAGKARHWRANTAAVNGFAARYYLTINNYNEALKYANNALNEYNVLVDYNVNSKMGMTYGQSATVTLNAGTPQVSTFVIRYPYTHDNQDVTDLLGWKEFLYFRTLTQANFWYTPSQDLLNLYDKAHDLRYAYHIVEGYSYDRGMIKPSYEYPGYIFFYKDRIPSGPTVAEMILIKAEALARLNNPSEAMKTLNILRAKRMTPGVWVDLTATSQEDAILKVLAERRREMPFTQRWNDIKRLNNNELAADDIVLNKTFYPFTAAAVQNTMAPVNYALPKNSRRFAVPIPETEIISSNGEIQQNTY